MITQELVKELFDYHEDGFLIRKTDGNRHNACTGQVAGSKDDDDYKKVRVGNERYKVHQIIYLWHKGYIPKYIDHIDTVIFHNWIDNLRDCTQHQNSCNAKLSKANTSGVKGVFWRSSRSRWIGRVTDVDGNRVIVGSFKDIADAEVAVRKKRIELHGEFTNHG